MNQAETFFQSLELIPNAVWYKEVKASYGGQGSCLMIGDQHSGACLAKVGKYYIMGYLDRKTNTSTRFVVNTETKEVRSLPTTNKVRDVKEILRP